MSLKDGVIRFELGTVGFGVVLFLTFGAGFLLGRL